MIKNLLKKMNLVFINNIYLMIINKLILLYYKYSYSNLYINCC